MARSSGSTARCAWRRGETTLPRVPGVAPGAKSMLINSRKVRIQWGDCDPAGIVFFPRYFAIFDDSTAMLFERALGMTKFELMQRHQFSGFPLVDIHARFLIPSRFGDDVVVESGVSAFRRSSFDVQHRLLKAGQLAVDCL